MKRYLLSLALIGISALLSVGCMNDQKLEQTTTLAANEGKLVLLWDDNSNDEDGFHVERKLKNEPATAWSQIAHTAANIETYTDTTPTPGSEYCYRVRAFNSAGNSSWTNEACGQVQLADAGVPKADLLVPAPDASVPKPDLQVNHAPVAKAGADQHVAEGDKITLDGSGSKDPDGDTLTYTWTQTTGPQVTLSDPHAVRPTFTAPSVATTTTLTFGLKVSDAKLESPQDTVDVTVNDSSTSCHSGALFNWSYCSVSCPCAHGEGDCDSDAECQPGTVCKQNVGAKYGQVSSLDVCETKVSSCHVGQPFGWDYCSASCPCAQGQGDCDADSECSSGLVCAQNVGEKYGAGSSVDVCESCQHRGSVFGWDYCSSSCPCARGEGDCDSNAECQPGTVCKHNVGANYGQVRSLDVCE